MFYCFGTSTLKKIVAATWKLRKFHRLLLKSHITNIHRSKKNPNSGIQVENHGKQQNLTIYRHDMFTSVHNLATILVVIRISQFSLQNLAPLLFIWPLFAGMPKMLWLRMSVDWYEIVPKHLKKECRNSWARIFGNFVETLEALMCLPLDWRMSHRNASVMMSSSECLK